MSNGMIYRNIEFDIYVFFSGRLKSVGINCKSSIGSTPSCSHPVKDMGQLSEVHPGNYVFYGVWVDAVVALYLHVKKGPLGPLGSTD